MRRTGRLMLLWPLRPLHSNLTSGPAHVTAGSISAKCSLSATLNVCSPGLTLGDWLSLLRGWRCQGIICDKGRSAQRPVCQHWYCVQSGHGGKAFPGEGGVSAACGRGWGAEAGLWLGSQESSHSPATSQAALAPLSLRFLVCKMRTFSYRLKHCTQAPGIGDTLDK